MRRRDSVLAIGLILAATVQLATGQTATSQASTSQTATDSDRPCRSITCPLV